MSKQKDPGSFRDPSGFVFLMDGTIFRQINPEYQENYEHLIESGLYQRLIKESALIPHDEVEEKVTSAGQSQPAYKLIRPEKIPFISYPYEWCYSQLQDAALTTLKIQKTALDYGMSLKDCSAFNIQFNHGKPVLIDTLSFEKYQEGKPWVAYRQFCQHFLAPLMLMRYKGLRLNQLFRVFLDGIPLDLASALLPWTTWGRFSLLTNIHLHAFFQRRHTARNVTTHKGFSRLALAGLLDSLESAVKRIKIKGAKSVWSNYYDETNYSDLGFSHKKEVVSNWLNAIQPLVVWDLGGNVGFFSRLVSERGVLAISFDMDPLAVECNYRQAVKEQNQYLLPLLIDLTNPSPDLGWANQERYSLLARGPSDVVMALALIHHLAVSNNLPFSHISSFFAKICDRFLIIEFVPKTDSNFERVLGVRDDIFGSYTEEAFVQSFQKYFILEDSVKLKESERILYLMSKK
jgi:hypothetical protein